MAPAKTVDRALALLGPLEARIMRAIWTGRVAQPFVVRDVQAFMPELAYTTVMTTVARLAEKGVLEVERGTGRQAHQYQSVHPEEFLRDASQRSVDEAVDAFGDVALAAFAARLDALTPRQRERLRKLVDQ